MRMCEQPVAKREPLNESNRIKQFVKKNHPLSTAEVMQSQGWVTQVTVAIMYGTYESAESTSL